MSEIKYEKTEKRAFTVNFPVEEAEAVLKAAEKKNISITLLFRMWVRKELMNNPIK